MAKKTFQSCQTILTTERQRNIVFQRQHTDTTNSTKEKEQAVPVSRHWFYISPQNQGRHPRGLNAIPLNLTVKNETKKINAWQCRIMYIM
ncbi:MAG: hypothetical protein KKD78_08820, partial [Proteobacteria bacterium]|nr:hypothetical protein [Pseudomonadota bacterium]